MSLGNQKVDRVFKLGGSDAVQIVALANLLPVEAEVDELDSFMYQTVGHQLVESYAACMDLPLFRKHIRGSAQAAELSYCQTDGDEVEDLYALLAYVQQIIPGIQAVSSGAIASTYQRLRVENVASRLGLTSLSYLWMQPQRQLLQRMINSDIEAILVKVAALGLEPRKHLGKTLQQMQPTLLKLSSQFGCNVCGEGGEYETLTLNCPLFTDNRIILKDWSIELHSPGECAAVGILHPVHFSLQSKATTGTGTASDPHSLSKSASFRQTSRSEPDAEERASGLNGHVFLVPEDFRADKRSALVDEGNHRPSNELCRIELSQGQGLLYATGRARLSADEMESNEFASAAFSSILQLIQEDLKVHGASLAEAVVTQIGLKSMSHFAAMNEIYKKFFPAVRPAARACIELPLPSDEAFVLEILVGKEDFREVLHVQSISHWAPSCIGPYSQAVKIPGLIFLAGQIGLNPPTMQLLPDLQSQVKQSFESCQAIATALRTDFRGNLLALKLYSSKLGGIKAAEAMRDTIQDLEEGNNNLADSAEEDSYLRVIPEQRNWMPLCTYLQVPALPRGADVEIQPLLCCSSAGEPEDATSSGEEEKADQRSGWIGRMQYTSGASYSGQGQLLVESLMSVGKACLCTLSISTDTEKLGKDQVSGPITSIGSPTQGSSLLNETSEGFMGHLRGLEFQVVALLKKAASCLKEAQLDGQSVVSLHLYHRADLLGSVDACSDAISKVLKSCERGPELENAAVVCVPVTAVGTTFEMVADMQLHLLAYGKM